MKKILVLTILSIFVLSGYAFADITETASSGIDHINGAGGQVAAGAISSGDNISKLSTGVALGWNTTTSGYAIIASHENGTKAFGTAHDSTAIYVNDTDPTDAPGAADVSGVNTADWSAL